MFIAFLELFSGRSTLESIDDLLTQYQLRWLGHVAWMPDTRYPKQMLFGWLPQTWGQASLEGQGLSVFKKSVKLASHHGIAMDA